MSPKAVSRMSLLNVETSRCVQPYRTLAFGPEKVGKTSMLAEAPNCIALDVENRMGHVDVMKFPVITTWQEALDALEVLRVEKHGYENVLIDSVSALEKLLKLQVMADAPNGGWTAIEADEFQRWAKVAASSYWPQFFAACERLEREKGMGILMTAHCQIKNMKNPNGEPYDRYRPALCGEIGPQLFLHYCHDILFCTFEDVVRTEKKGGKDRIKTSTTGNRIIRTRHTPAWDAGNSCGLPQTISPMSWATYAKERARGLGDLPALQEQIEEALKEIKDESVRAKAAKYYEANKENVIECRRVRERLVNEILPSQEEVAEVPAAK